MQKGMQEEKEALAINFLKMRIAPEIVAQGTALFIEQILEISQRMKKDQ